VFPWHTCTSIRSSCRTRSRPRSDCGRARAARGRASARSTRWRGTCGAMSRDDIHLAVCCALCTGSMCCTQEHRNSTELARMFTVLFSTGRREQRASSENRLSGRAQRTMSCLRSDKRPVLSLTNTLGSDSIVILRCTLESDLRSLQLPSGPPTPSEGPLVHAMSSSRLPEMSCHTRPRRQSGNPPPDAALHLAGAAAGTR